MFNEEDFRQRVEQAAVKLGFVEPGLSEDELDDLVNLAVNGEIREPVSPLGEHVNARWHELVGPADRSLVHWLRRLVFRSAWLDQRVKEGELDIVFREDTQSFGYLQRDRGSELIELAPEPSWRRPPTAASPAARTASALEQLVVRRRRAQRARPANSRPRPVERAHRRRAARPAARAGPPPQRLLARACASAAASIAGCMPARGSSGSSRTSALGRVEQRLVDEPRAPSPTRRGRLRGSSASPCSVLRPVENQRLAPSTASASGVGASLAAIGCARAEGAREPGDRVEHHDHVLALLGQALAALERKLGELHVLARRSVAGRGVHLDVAPRCPVRHLLGAHVDQHDDQCAPRRRSARAHARAAGGRARARRAAIRHADPWRGARPDRPCAPQRVRAGLSAQRDGWGAAPVARRS